MRLAEALDALVAEGHSGRTCHCGYSSICRRCKSRSLPEKVGEWEPRARQVTTDNEFWKAISIEVGERATKVVGAGNDCNTWW